MITKNKNPWFLVNNNFRIPVGQDRYGHFRIRQRSDIKLISNYC